MESLQLVDASSQLDPAKVPASSAGNGDSLLAIPAAERDWASLPLELLAAILRPLAGTHKSLRLVCRQFRSACDASMRAHAGASHATMHLATWLLQHQHQLPEVPACVRIARLDASWLTPRDASEWDGGWAGLFAALQTWPPAAPAASTAEADGPAPAATPAACGVLVELDLSGIGGSACTAGDLEAVAGVLRSPVFALGGLQALDLRVSQDSDVKPDAVAAALVTALPSAPQLWALRELRLSDVLFGLWPGKLCAALAAATHVRSLTLLDLSHSDLKSEGAAALAACLGSARHLSTLQRLALRRCSITGDGAVALAAAVGDASLKLVALDLGWNNIGDAQVAAWAAALQAGSCLAGLTELDLSGNDITDSGMDHFTAALRAATHLTGLRRLALVPNECEPGCMVRALAAAPHIAASLECLSLHRAELETGEAMDGVAAPLLAGLQLPRLTSLDLTGCRICLEGSVRSLCGLLRAATQLSVLRELDLSSNNISSKERGQMLFDALVAASHLGRLQRLDVTCSELAQLEDAARLLRAAPHLRGLTAIRLFQLGEMTPAAHSALHEALTLLPGLRSLSVARVHHTPRGKPRKPSGLRLADALQAAPCLERLEELTLGVHDAERSAREEVACLVSWLGSCTRLSGLSRLDFRVRACDEGSCAALGDALAGASHLSRLRALRLQLGGNVQDGGDEQEGVRALRRRLAGSHLSGVARVTCARE